MTTQNRQGDLRPAEAAAGFLLDAERTTAMDEDYLDSLCDEQNAKHEALLKAAAERNDYNRRLDESQREL